MLFDYNRHIYRGPIVWTRAVKYKLGYNLGGRSLDIGIRIEVVISLDEVNMTLVEATSIVFHYIHNLTQVPKTTIAYLIVGGHDKIKAGSVLSAMIFNTRFSFALFSFQGIECPCD